jgi:hypothetical protein
MGITDLDNQGGACFGRFYCASYCKVSYLNVTFNLTAVQLKGEDRWPLSQSYFRMLHLGLKVMRCLRDLTPVLIVTSWKTTGYGHFSRQTPLSNAS